VGIDVIDRVRVHPAVGQGDGRGACCIPPVGPRLDHVVGVGGRTVAEKLGVGRGASPFRGDRILEHHQRRRLAHDKAVAACVERSRRRRRIVVPALGESPDDVERPEGQRRQRDLTAAGDGRVHPTLAQVAERLAQGDGPGCARVGRGQDGPPDIEGDAEVRRRGATEHGQGQVRGDLPDALLQIPLVLGLGVGDAAQGRPEVDADAFGIGGPGDTGHEASVLHREAPGHQRELAEAVQLTRRPGVHPGQRIEVVDLSGDLRAERRRIEAVDAPHGRAPGTQSSAEGINAGPARGDQPDAGDPDPPPRGHPG